MTVTIQLGTELYDHIRTLVHDELDEQENRQRIEPLAMKIPYHPDQRCGPNRFTTVLKVHFGVVLNDPIFP